MPDIKSELCGYNEISSPVHAEYPNPHQLLWFDFHT